MNLPNREYPFLAIKGPEGHINHMHIGLNEEMVIDRFVNEERVLRTHGIGDSSPKNWEHLEAEGYSIVPIKITPKPDDIYEEARRILNTDVTDPSQRL